jgi:putative membrane protein
MVGSSVTDRRLRADPRRWTVEQQPPNAGQQSDRPDHHGKSALRRTWLSSERTYLAWFRTGLGTIGVALAVGRLIPALIGGPRVAYATLGVGYGVLGAFMIAYALVRAKRIDVALDVNGPVTPDWWALAGVTAVSLALAVATIVMVLIAV